jgi:hypothetical protein
MTPAQALAFVKRHGIVLESARGPVPSLAATVAGELLRGGWWSHPKGNEIFLLSRAIRNSPEVLVCRIVNGKVTYVHRHLWPALVLLAKRFSRQNLAAIKEVHTATGRHKLLVTPFPDWVPKPIRRAADELEEQEATSQLAAILNERKNGRAG